MSVVRTPEVPRSDYDVAVQILEAELGQVEQVFRGLTESDWRTPTLLRPVDEKLPPWTLVELAGHFHISIGLAPILLARHQPGHVGPDRVSFFIFPRSAVAPRLYDYLFTTVDANQPGHI